MEKGSVHLRSRTHANFSCAAALPQGSNTWEESFLVNLDFSNEFFDWRRNISELNDAPNSKYFTFLSPALFTFQQTNQKRPSLPATIKMPVRFSLKQTSPCRKVRSGLIVITGSAARCVVCNPSHCLP